MQVVNVQQGTVMPHRAPGALGRRRGGGAGRQGGGDARGILVQQRGVIEDEDRDAPHPHARTTASKAAAKCGEQMIVSKVFR